MLTGLSAHAASGLHTDEMQIDTPFGRTTVRYPRLPSHIHLPVPHITFQVPQMPQMPHMPLPQMPDFHLPSMPQMHGPDGQQLQVDRKAVLAALSLAATLAASRASSSVSRLNQVRASFARLGYY